MGEAQLTCDRRDMTVSHISNLPNPKLTHTFDNVPENIYRLCLYHDKPYYYFLYSTPRVLTRYPQAVRRASHGQTHVQSHCFA